MLVDVLLWFMSRICLHAVCIYYYIRSISDRHGFFEDLQLFLGQCGHWTVAVAEPVGVLMHVKLSLRSP